jgi:hypothetical protein
LWRVLRRIGHRIADAGHRLRARLPGARPWIAAGVVVLAVAGGLLAYSLLDDDDPREPAAAPQAVVQQVEASDDETEELGFPAFATKNTTRISGADPAANAAAVALATYPSTGGLEGPAAVSLVDASDWPGAIAAASLVAEPIGAPLLFTDGDEVPDLTSSALAALAPRGSAETEDKQVFRIGDVADVEGLRAMDVEGQNPAALAAELEKARAELTGQKPAHIVVASSDEPAMAMPAAAWAARSGDPVLFAQRNSVPQPTIEALERRKGVPVYVLGPESAISDRAFEQIEKVADGVERVAASDPVGNAIAFARYTDGSFGWNINDPGHGFVLTSSEIPADAGAAAPLSASGTWGPLLLTDDATKLPSELRGYLLDVKPGYQDDPTRAVYNHVWVIGDPGAISVQLQAQVDELAELVQVTSGTGSDVLGAPPGTVDPEKESPDSGSGSGQDGGGQDR